MPFSQRKPSRRQILAAALLAPALRAAPAKDHPRLIALDADLDRARQLIQSNADCRRIHTQLTAQADRILTEPPVEYVLIGPRLLDKSRRALDRIYTLALLWRLDHKQSYFDRAVRELEAVCNFPDWHPPHFLDTAEMTHAVAIGYDWLYPALTPAQRKSIRAAIVTKGLDPGLDVYRSKGWWSKSEFNWNQVCNGGLAIGALAVAEDEPQRSHEVLDNAIQSLPLAMASYAPDGGWAEGPGYWDYATRYTVYMLAALESATGSDHDLAKAAGFDQAGRFRIYATSPLGLSFDYADAGSRVGPCASMFWLARRFHNPVYAWQQQLLRKGRPDALDLIWYQENAKSPAEAAWPLQATFTGVDVAFLRSSWDSSDAAFFAIKGGDNKANHGHLDLGSFVFDAGGVRYAIDFGGDDYNLPEYFGKQRWTYYRLRTESHNAVLIDGENQDLNAKAHIRGNTVDLAQTYPGKLRSFTRTFALDGSCLKLTDRIEARQPVDVLWGMVTPVDVQLNGRTAMLGGKLHAVIETPAEAKFELVSTQPPAPQNPNQGTRKLVVRLPGKVESVTLTVTLSV